jgi:hypothetical protein
LAGADGGSFCSKTRENVDGFVGARKQRPVIPGESYRSLDEAYAAAMEEVWKQFPHDPDVGALYAESLMNLQPWDLWTKHSS